MRIVCSIDESTAAGMRPRSQGSSPVGCGPSFSTGSEQRPDAPAKLRVGRYSQGADQLPDSPRKLRIGRFSTGIEQRPGAPDTLRHGSFADGYAEYR